MWNWYALAEGSDQFRTFMHKVTNFGLIKCEVLLVTPTAN